MFTNSTTDTDVQVYALTAADGDAAALMNNSSGSVVERYAYDPYGSVTFLTPSYGSRSSSSYGWAYLHQGLRWDSIVDLYDNRARAYSPTLMRFLQNDPIGFMAGDANTYRYEGDGPTERIDPLGLSYITDVTGDGDFRKVLRMILGREPTDDDETMGNEGCTGIVKVALGRATNGRLGYPHAVGARAFSFDHDPTMGELKALLAAIGSSMDCPAGQEARMFAVQFWAYKGPNVGSPVNVGNGISEIDPNNIGINIGVPEGAINFNFALLYTFANNPDSEFWLSMNRGRIRDATEAAVYRDTLRELQGHQFTHTIYCVKCGRPSTWFSTDPWSRSGFREDVPVPVRNGDTHRHWPP